jgi:TPP-dependent pyruvate/acetoin dehydrogenase alpha subunit
VGYRSEEELAAWKQNCPIALLEEALTARGSLSAQQKASWIADADAEIAESFRFAKSSPFPGAGDWSAMNHASSSPVADAMLADIDVDAFDANQAMVQAKGY